MTPAEDTRYHALHDRATAAATRWQCIRDDTWGDESAGARRREDLAYTRARNAEATLLKFVYKMANKYHTKGTP
ncbi:hypothetical protein UFOVP929_45 [uncultured Caudovirales phage]|uniref:Uncharacterized protein n=1 Tax=uncultured Caudovirales phage TaxID=2100421 RepID=A0A6J5PSU2_9CAUD|nr:hypothetical protein UFOVP929_45 [uncultured Caudovirales phage]